MVGTVNILFMNTLNPYLVGRHLSRFFHQTIYEYVLKKVDLVTVSMAPHHPSMHGVLQFIVTLDGENVVDCKQVLFT